MTEIREMTTDAEVLETFPVMRQLRPWLTEDTYVDAVQRRRADYGYHLVARIEEGWVVCVAGYKYSHSFHFLKYMYVDDLVSDETVRSRGHGDALFDWLEAESRCQGCANLRLDTGVQRIDAQRFYDRKGMTFLCQHRVKEINGLRRE